MVCQKSRVWIEISKSALLHNIRMLKAAIKGAFLAPVIKCNAYGHGLIEIGTLCNQMDEVEYICVAFLSEALQLRNAGVTKPILVLSYCDTELALAVRKQISFVVDSHEQIQQLHTVAQHHETTFEIHIKVDIGMTRRGIDPAQALSFIMVVLQVPHIMVSGICSHFSSVYRDSKVTQKQAALFYHLVATLISYGVVIPFIHISNSSLYDVDGCNFYRPGLSVYGYGPHAKTLGLRPVLSLKTVIAQIRDVVAGTYIGYDCLYKAPHNMRIALVPFGYADGYDIRLSNTTAMYCKGAYAAMRGRIGMNMNVIDISTITNAQVGDEVVVVGDYHDIRADELCNKVGLGNVREFLALLNSQLPRIIVQ